MFALRAVHRRSAQVRTLLLAFFAPIALLASPACEEDDRGAHPDGIGNYCEANDDCETGECYLGPGGGYCTTECSNEGSIDECPEDTVCKPIQGGARRCLLVCGSASACDTVDNCQDDYCPGGSSCVSVGNTDLFGCEPDPN